MRRRRQAREKQQSVVARLVQRAPGFIRDPRAMQRAAAPHGKRIGHAARIDARRSFPRGPLSDDPRSREWGLLFSRLWITAFGNAFEQRRRQIALARIRQHRQDDGARRRFRGDLRGRGERAARGDAAEDAFAARQRAGSFDRFDVRDRQQAMRRLRD